MAQSETVTILFSELVNSVDHLQNLGDEKTERVFHAHHKLISDAISSCGGEELEWLGDGALASFRSAAEAVNSAIKMQQSSQTTGEVGLEMRIGLHVGEVLRRDGGYFGTPIVVARRLCDRAEAGQILCSQMLADFLSARATFEFRDLGKQSLKGIGTPLGVSEVVYEGIEPGSMLNRTPFVGRARQMRSLGAKLSEVMNGRGSIVMVSGEAGIGKTRMLEEFCESAIVAGATVLKGACYDGEWQAPYGAFAEAIAGHARGLEKTELASLLGKRAGIVARIAPVLHDLVDDLPAPPEIAGEDERFRLFDAVAQFLIAIANRGSLVLILDDLHWSDRGVASMLSHVAHFSPNYPILIVGAYRDAEVTRHHPLNTVLTAVSRLRGFESVTLKGLKGDDVAAMLGKISHETVPAELVAALGETTEGNPLFIREVLLYLYEEGRILADGRGWIKNLSVEQLGIPEGVRQVINQRLSRLSSDANHLLTVAAAFNGAFSFEVAAAAAAMDETTALAAVDEALTAQLLRPGTQAETFDFTHALIRHTLYANLNPPRRTRLHRKIAEEMERTWGDRAAQHAAEVAFHFWRAATTGTNRGADYAIAAAQNAASSYAYDDAATFLRIALDLLPNTDDRRMEILMRLSQAQTWSLNAQEALTTANEAGALVLKTRGSEEAANYYEQIARAMFNAGLTRESWKLAQEGLRHVGARRDIVWASLTDIDINRAEAEDPASPGVALDSPESRALAVVLNEVPRQELTSRNIELIYFSREEVVRSEDPRPRPVMMTGDYRAAEARWRREAVECEQRGAISQSLRAWAGVARCHNAMGNFVEAQAAFDHATALSARIARPSFGKLALQAARVEFHLVMNENLPQLVADIRNVLGGADQEVLDIIQGFGPEGKWGRSVALAFSAVAFSSAGEVDMGASFLSLITDAIERGAPWSLNYIGTACMAATASWILNRTDNIELIERNIREKVVKPDFHFPMSDGRLSLARLCALAGRFDEASEWFRKARELLEANQTRPLRAIADYDEALMYLRRGKGDDRERAGALLHSALIQFEQIGMRGWIASANKLAAAYLPELQALPPTPQAN